MTVWCEIRDVLQKANACEETILEKLEKNDGEIEDDFRELFRLYLRCRGLKLWLSENLYQKYLALFDELLVIGRRMMGCTVNKDFSAQQSEFIDRLKTHMGISKEMIRMAQRREQQAAMTTFYESPRFADKPEMKCVYAPPEFADELQKEENVNGLSKYMKKFKGLLKK